MQSGHWQDLTTEDFAAIDADATVALWPVAAVEQHGPHLPLATDALIARGAAAAVLGRVPAGVRLLVLPSLDIGHSPEHEAFPGTLSASAETLLALFTQVGHGVAAAGVRKLVLLNAHGGQKSIVDLAATRLRRDCGLLVVRAHTFSLGVPPGLFEPRELLHGLHGGDVETSLMLHLRPDLVRMEKAADFVGLPQRFAAEYALLGAEKPAGIGWLSQDLGPHGVVGNAAAASADKGRRCFEHIVARLEQLVAEVAAAPLASLK